MDMFNLEDLYDDNSGQRDGATAVDFVIRALLAVTTAGFFFVYAGNLFQWLVGSLSPYLSAVVGVFSIDFLAWYWDVLRQRNATTHTQLAVAKMAIVSLPHFVGEAKRTTIIARGSLSRAP